MIRTGATLGRDAMGQVIPFKRRGANVEQGPVSNVNLRPVAAFYADREGQFDFVNSEWCRLARCSQTEAFGAGWLNAVHRGDRRYVAEQWCKAVRDEKLFSIEFRLAGAQPACVLLQALPQYDSEGNCTGYSGTLIALGALNLNAQVKPALPFSREAESGETGGPEQRLHQAIDLAGLCYF
jgi:PAS fold